MASGGLVNPLIGLAGYAIGTASGPALRPLVQHLANDAWAQHTVRQLSVHDAAALWVEGEWTRQQAIDEGARTGYSVGRVEALHGLIDEPPDVATLYALWRRNLISGDDFIRGLRHAHIETDYFEAMRQARNVLLTPEQLAAARVKGHITQQRQYDEAELWGVTNDRAQIMYETTGNPPGPETLITMLNRGIITPAEFTAGIKQGNIRPEYVDEYLGLRHHLLTAHEIVNLRLRGWIGDGEMVSRGAAVGYDADAMHDMFLGQGRPITFRQVFIGERRGGVYDGGTGAIEPAFLKSLQEGNTRPEWYNLAWAQRHTLPSAFVLRALTQSGDITEADAERLLLWHGWPEDLAAKVSAAWAPGEAGGADAALVKTYRNRAITEIQSAFVLGQADDGQVSSWLGALELSPETVTALLAIWRIMQEVPQTGLTAAQIKKAYRKLPAQWPRSRALAEIEQLGYTADDAATLLDE